MEPKHRVVALTVSCALFMQSIDSTVLGTALVPIARDYGVDPVRMHMVLTAYLISLAVFLPLSGWLADRYGARTVFRLAVLLFTLASVACAFAPNLQLLVAARIVQGAGGAMMTPVARLVLLRTVPRSQIVNAMAWVSIPALVGPLIGPPLGGFIITYGSWPWVFWINVPIGLVGIILSTRYMGNIREASVPPIDMLGFALVAIAVGGLLFGLETSGGGLFPEWANAVAIGAGAVALFLYIRHARHTPAPILNLELLRLPTFYAGVIGGSVFRIGIGALPFLLPLMLQAGFGYNPLTSGLTTFSAAAGAIAMKFVAQPAIKRFGFRDVLIWNAVLSGISIACCALFAPSTPLWIIFAVLLVGGFFRSLEFTALNSIAYADLRVEQMSQGTSFSTLMQQLSLSLGIGLSAMMLDLLRMSGLVPAEGGFSITFALVGAIIFVAAWQFSRLSQSAGSEVSGRRIGGPRDGLQPARTDPEAEAPPAPPAP